MNAFMRQNFFKSIESGFELGAAITLEIEGETVIDLWGGHQDKERNKAWREDNDSQCILNHKRYSCNLSFTANRKEELDLEKPVCNYWPEFGQNGKETIPIKYLFCHKSGLCGIREPLISGSLVIGN